MKKVKLIESYGHEVDAGDYYSTKTFYTFAKEVPWAEISDEDFKLLSEYVNRGYYDRNGRRYRDGGMKLTLLVEVPEVSDEKDTIASYIQEAKGVVEKETQHALAIKRRNEKRQKTLDKKREDKERKVLEELQRKYNQ